MELEEKHGSLIRGMLARIKQMRAHAKPGAKSNITMFMTLRHGLIELVSAIVSKLEGVEIKTGARVKGVLKKEGGYEVLVDGGHSIEADSVVIAAPAYVASELVKALDKELSEKLLSIPYVSTATVSIGYKKKRHSPSARRVRLHSAEDRETETHGRDMEFNQVGGQGARGFRAYKVLHRRGEKRGTRLS